MQSSALDNLMAAQAHRTRCKRMLEERQAELDQLFASKLFRKTSCATATARRRRATRSRPATAAAEAADDGADASAALDAALG